MFSGNKQTIKGDGNQQTVNNIEQVFFCEGVKTLTHSVVQELLQLVYSQPAPKDDSFSLEAPAEMNEKLRFNKAFKYVDIIENHSDDYMRVEEVMKDCLNSEDIVKKLRDMFLDVAQRDAEGKITIGEGDKELDAIKDKLVTLIVNDKAFDSDRYTLEEVEQFCIALIAYGVSRCKILEAPK